MLGEFPGTYYTETSLPAVASSDNTAYQALVGNPFSGSAKIVSIHLIPIADITGDNTNSNNWNVDLVATTEVANLDFPTGVTASKGVAKAFTLSGTAAQLKIAAGGCVLVEREEVGTQPVRAVGSRIRIGWQGAGA